MKASRKIVRTESIAFTRFRLGMSQEKFAAQLGISRSMLSKVELKQRSLSTAALIKLSRMEISLAGEATISAASNSPKSAVESTSSYPGEFSAAALQYREACCRKDAQRKEYELEVMMHKHKVYEDCIIRTDRLLQEAAAGNTQFYPGQLEAHREGLIRKLAKCALPAQADLRHKIALQYASADLHLLNATSHYGNGCVE